MIGVGSGSSPNVEEGYEMALLYLLDDDVAVDERGWEWDLIDGTWRPREEWAPPKLRLVVADPPNASREASAETTDT
jgi:hypothetical protein